MSTKVSKMHIEVSAKGSLKARTDFAGVVAKQAPLSSFVQSQPAVKAACDGVINAGADLAAAETDMQALKTQLAEARSNLETKRKAFDAAYDVCMAQTECYAAVPSEVQSVGFVVRDRAQRQLVAPVAVAASFNIVKGLLEIEVKQPAGVRQCILEISPDPVGAGTWQRLEGTGMRRKLTGYASGMYWVRAANMRATARSEYTAPVAVIVK